MFMEETAKIILSGEYSHRRGYLTNVMTSLNALVVIATLSIWGFFINWDSLYGETQNHQLFAITIAWASGLSSVLLGLWRFYERVLDAEIVKLYPAIYLCEAKILPKEISSINPLPKNITRLTGDVIPQDVEWINVRNKDFTGRGHGSLDWLAVILIFFFVIVNLATGFRLNVTEINLRGDLHLITYLLIFNTVGILLVLGGWWRWRNIKVKWPVPRTDKMNQKDSKNKKPTDEQKE